jgi:enamine deaminase RidA (YjgF/YER057c/UK114 family)
MSPSSLLFIGGNVSADADGNTLGKGDLGAQLRHTFDNMRKVLAAGGMDFAHVVKFTTYLTSPTAIPEFYAAREELFASLYPTGEYPPNTLLVVSRLVNEEYLIEIEAIAAR